MCLRGHGTGKCVYVPVRQVFTKLRFVYVLRGRVSNKQINKSPSDIWIWRQFICAHTSSLFLISQHNLHHQWCTYLIAVSMLRSLQRGNANSVSLATFTLAFNYCCFHETFAATVRFLVDQTDKLLMVKFELRGGCWRICHSCCWIVFWITVYGVACHDGAVLLSVGLEIFFKLHPKISLKHYTIYNLIYLLENRPTTTLKNPQKVLNNFPCIL